MRLHPSKILLCACFLLLLRSSSLGIEPSDKPGLKKHALPLTYTVVHGWPQVPENTTLGEVSGVSIDREDRILVTEMDGTMVGLIVDSASEVLKLQQGDVEPPPSDLFDSDNSYVTGVGKLNERLIILLDLKKILGKAELQPLQDLKLPQTQAVTN